MLTSFGSFGDSLALGAQMRIHHDQTGRDRGVFRVIGIRSYATGETWGIVPSRALGHWVFK